jgi:hypothetical protein
VAPRRARALQWLSNTVLRATTESRSSPIGHINLDRKQAGKPSARNGHARFEAAGTENQLTIRLVRHSQRKRGATDRSDLRSVASVLDPTDRGGGGNVGIIRSPLPRHHLTRRPKGTCPSKTRPGHRAGKTRPVSWSGYVKQQRRISSCGSRRFCTTSTTWKHCAWPTSR